MTDTKADATRKAHIHLELTTDEMAVVNDLAQLKGFRSRTAYVRSLIERDAEEAGVPLTLASKWGGWRGGPKAGRE